MTNREWGANVAFWPVATNFSLGPDVSFRGEAEVGRAAEPSASVENDPICDIAAWIFVVTHLSNDVIGCRRPEG